MKTNVVLRRNYQPEQTEGVLSVTQNGHNVYGCQTIELPWLNNAIGKSCIPEGDYILRKRTSAKYKKHLIILNTDGSQPKPRSWVLIHPANYFYQLRGCIAPGLSKCDLDGDGKLDVKSSRTALDLLLNILPDDTPFTITKQS